MLKLHKRYLIISSVRITKKLTQQYIGPFQVIENPVALLTNWTYRITREFTLFSL